MIYSIKGSGNFVNPKRITYTISQDTTFTQEILKAGREPKLKYLESKIIQADKFISEKLNIKLNEKVLYLENMRFVDDNSFLFAKYFINIELIDNYEIFSTTNSISKVYEKYGLEPTRKNSEIDIVSSSNKLKKIFTIQHDLPIVKIATKTIDKKTNKVIDYCFSNFRSDMAKIVVDYKGGN